MTKAEEAHPKAAEVAPLQVTIPPRLLTVGSVVKATTASAAEIADPPHVDQSRPQPAKMYEWAATQAQPHPQDTA